MENEIMFIKLDDIIPNRFQPREIFNEEELNKLADSIRQHGVIEPIIVRPVSNKYEIIAGERRYKASVLAGLTKIPAIVRQMDDKESSIVAFIENEHRSDVSAIEEARTMDRILKNNNMTQEELAKELGINQSTVANKLRLLNLPFEIQDALMHNRISERHARSLLSVKDEEKQKELLNQIIERKMSVRELDSEIKSMNENMNIYNENNSFNGLNSSDFANTGIPSYETPQNISNGFNRNDYLNSPLPSEPVASNVNPAPVDDNFMSFLNNYDANNPLPSNEMPKEPVSSSNSDFMSFLNNYDANYKIPSEMTPVAEEKTVNEPSAPADDNFMNYLNNYDTNNPLSNDTSSTEGSDTTPGGNSFLNFLNNYDANYKLPSETVPKEDIPVSQPIENNYLNTAPTNNVTIESTHPPITSGFEPKYVEDSANYVDITKQEKISSVDEVIDKLSKVVNEIKEKSIYKIDTEEINYDDIYQITIKIDKRDF